MIKEYYRPRTIREAQQIKSRSAKSVYLAGGTEVNRNADKDGFDSVIDIRNIVPSGITKEGTDILIGAMTTLQEIYESSYVHNSLKEAAGSVFSRNIRNQATIGGNIGADKSDSSIIPVLMAMDASIRTMDGAIPIEEYLLEKHKELILEILIPAPVGACVYIRESKSFSSPAVVNAAVSITVDKGLPNYGLSGACIALGCVERRVIRLKKVEEAIVSGNLKTKEDVEKAVYSAITPESDFLGSSEYKKYINSVKIAQAVVKCLEALV